MSKAVESYETEHSHFRANAPIQLTRTEPDGPTTRVRLGVKRNESITPELFPDRAVANLKRTAEFVNKLRIQRLDLLPYHRLGEPKYRRLKRPYRLEEIRSLTDKETAKARWILEQAGLEVRLGG